ncbi:sensor histidine kinase KdpD [Paenibacillus sp. 32352]|uniref:sensor histidine kinase n=1 Tax=Paenibacillus sp. 32352 TaxID=1969111 RepID=UPI0009ACED48|nr:HAMP domain-containing sensor histidine kinase [Paenibacillus sp. 32352]
MKWKLTGRFLVSVVLIVILVVFFNMVLLLGLLIAHSVIGSSLFNRSEASAETMTRNFAEQIVIANHQVSLTEEGQEVLLSNKAWIQVLDEDGRQVFSYLTPEGVKDKYSPLDIIQMYKYKEINSSTTVYIGEKSAENYKYSYFIGVENLFLSRFVLSIDYRHAGRLFNIVGVLVLTMDGLIALFIGYLFSKRLTKPLHLLIDGIKSLAGKDYSIHFTQPGIYKDVFINMNHLSEELQAHENERKAMDRMKEEWIANISHDIKTPLASIQGYAEIMKDREYQFSIDEMREYAGIIERKSTYLKEVIDDLNLSTRLKNKQWSLNIKNLNLVTLIRNLVIATLNDARYSDRSIHFQYSQDIIMLELDEILMRRAISNLIYNSIVHNDEKVIIHVSVEQGPRTLIRIEDNGKGIKEEELGRIFDRYYRGTHTGELHKGSGLGMAIARDIIAAHGGEIQVSSQQGQGTRIQIVI